MKRNICILLSAILCVMAFLPVTAHAATYKLEGTDMSIVVDDTVWYVFTRENIKDNPELEELGVPYDTVYSTLYDNDAYMNAVVFYEDGAYVELLVRKKALDTDIANLSNYDEKEVSEFAQELAKRLEVETYAVYEGEYKFAKLEYFDAEYEYYIYEFTTIVNRDNYTLTFESEEPFTDEQKEMCEEIVDSVRFDVDPSIKERNDSIFDSVLTKTIGGAVAGGIAGGVIALVNKKKKKNKEEAPAEDNMKNE